MVIGGRELILEEAGGFPFYIIVGASKVTISGIEILGYTGPHQSRGLDAGICVFGNLLDITDVNGNIGAYTTKETAQNIRIENCVLSGIENGYINPNNPEDIRSDGVPDAVDNCPNACNSSQLDADGDGIGDVCDTTPGCGGCGSPLCEQGC